MTYCIRNFLFSSLLLLFLLNPMSVAMDLDLLGEDDLDLAGDDALLELEGGEPERDYELLKNSCRLELRYWNGVESGLRRRRGAEEDTSPKGWKWDNRKDGLLPISGKDVPVSIDIAVPEAGKYRIWLRRHIGKDTEAPVTLKLSGTNTGEYIFGKNALTSDTIKAQEKEFNFRIEEEAMRDSMLLMPMWLWDYIEVELKEGETKLELHSDSSDACITTLFLTQSLSFVPNMSATREYNNLDKMYYRFRVQKGAKGKNTYTMRAGVTFHWRFFPAGATQPVWGSVLSAISLFKDPVPIVSQEGDKNIPVGEWTDWVDATFCTTGAGPWFTVWPTFTGIEKGQADVQMAWFPDEGAVLKTVKPLVEKNRSVLEAPAQIGRIDFPRLEKEQKAVWGMVRPEFIDRLLTASQVHEQHIQWGKDAVAFLGLPEDHPKPKKLTLNASVNVIPAVADKVAKMLASLGVTTITGIDKDIVKKYGMRRSLSQAYSDWGYLVDTHDPADPYIPTVIDKNFSKLAETKIKQDSAFLDDLKRIKMGDEIGAIVGEQMINNSSDCRAKFHTYLAQILSDKNESPAFFGVDDVTELDFMGSMPDTPTRYQRRLYYHSQIFKYWLTADYYRNTTVGAEKYFPNAHTYANFTPHPALLGGQTMNHTDWFNLNRLGGANMAWGEDWASRGSWGYNGIEIVSFQGAWVECASRWGKMPSGFYAVLTQGAAHHKIFSLVSRNIDMIELYTYGPRYAGAEGSNFWSDNPAIYKELVIGTYALGPADTIIADGKQPDRKVAILYNRVHEIFNGGPYGMLCDRAISFTALGNGHYNPDLILVEDLNPERLARYSVLYINGFNLPSATVPVLRKWVENGGTLVGAAATGYLDEYNNPQPEMSEIFGAQQSYLASSEGRGWHPLGLKDHKPLTTLTLQETDLTPALETAVIGSIATLNPTTGKSIGTFEDGSCAAVINSLGKGKTLLYGFLPGILYKGDAEGSSTYHLEREPLITKPALATLGKPDFDIDAPQIEMALFEHESGMVITLNNFGYKRWQKDMAPATLSLKTDREISDVSTSFTGKLDWKREGDRIIVTVPVPNFVDCVILR